MIKRKRRTAKVIIKGISDSKKTAQKLQWVHDKFPFQIKISFLYEKKITMETKEKALKIFEKYYKQWESNSLRMDSGYQYESTFAEMIQKVEQEVFQLSVGKVPKSKNVKKTPDSIW